ncbi:MAG: hypothetical protein OEU87_08000 [Nitrospira sp.]|nr:hypothetical protein [Nitrospira sp.]
MDVSTLKSTIEALESHSDSLESWLFFWLACGFLGLVVQAFEEFNEHLLPMDHGKWKLGLKLLGFVMIFIGVVGQLGIQVKTGRVNTDLRNANKAVIGLLEKETESIRRDTLGLSLQLETARTDAADANALARKYEARIAEANARAAEAEKSAAQARLMAESEQHERVKLEALVAPRSLSLDQQRLIANAIRKFSGHAVTVASYGQDGEGAALATQIISVLVSAGIAVRDDRASIMRTGGFEYGVHLRGPAGEFILSLGNALSEIGKIQVFVNAPVSHRGSGMSGSASISGGGSVVNVPVPTTGPVSIMVGIKPLPGLIIR